MLAIDNLRIRTHGSWGCGVLFAYVRSSCGSNGTSSSPDADPNAPVSFTTIQTQVFTISCTFSGCHSADSPQQGMNLTAGSAYANLVVVPSVELADLGTAENRVTPGQPGQSYVVEKLQGSPPRSGVQMPVGQPLDSARIDLVVRWIQEGAQNN
jgi:hypothetical protein